VREYSHNRVVDSLDEFILSLCESGSRTHARTHADITDNIIAFGFPATGREAIYRNPREECIRFFESRHGKHYMVYNLCAEPERQYKSKIFDGRGM